MNEQEKAALGRDERKNEFLLKLSADRLNGLESALELNWIAHLLLAGIGLALVVPIGRFRDLLADYLVKGPYDQTVVSTVLLAILLYYFMKLGHLLTLYIEATSLQQRLLQTYVGADVDSTKLVLQKSTNFYIEAFFATKSLRDRDDFWPYLLVTTTIVSLAQATALYLVGQAFGLDRWIPCYVLLSGACVISFVVFVRGTPQSDLSKPKVVFLLVAVAAVFVGAYIKFGWATLILLVAEALMAILYLLFWGANRVYPQTRLVVVSSPALCGLWLIIFAVTRR
jgi:hypothetical protein